MSKERVLITGAAGGIGSATARLCNQLGATLVLSDFGQQAKLEELAQQLKGVTAVESCDVTDRTAVEAMIQRHAPFTALADTAGICPFDDDWMDPDWNDVNFIRVMKVNVLGPINLVRAILPGMIERKHGRIALCGSIAGWMGGLRAGPHYSASKGGVVGMTLPIARDLARNGIRNMTIAPGIFGTPMLFGMPQEVQDALAAGVPFPSRLGTPQDYARLAKHIFENDMLNGEVIRLDGAIRLAPK